MFAFCCKNMFEASIKKALALLVHPNMKIAPHSAVGGSAACHAHPLPGSWFRSSAQADPTKSSIPLELVNFVLYSSGKVKRIYPSREKSFVIKAEQIWYTWRCSAKKLKSGVPPIPKGMGLDKTLTRPSAHHSKSLYVRTKRAFKYPPRYAVAVGCVAHSKGNLLTASFVIS